MGAMVTEPSGSAAAQIKVVAPRASDDRFESVEYVRAVHSNLQEMVKLADQKAATLMGASGLIVALLGSNLVDKFRSDSVSWYTALAGAATLGSLLAAALSSIAALMPRFPGPAEVVPVPGAPGLMWGLRKHHALSAEYVDALLSVTAREVVADVAYENLKISWILERKWKWTGLATKLLFGAFIAWAIAVTLIVVGG
jgi:hypothetical protein